MTKWKFLTSLVLLVSFIILTSCKEDEAVYMAFDEVSYIKEFPLNFTLAQQKEVPINSVGLRSFRIVDSLLIVAKVGSHEMWDFYQLPKYQFLGEFLKKGEGPLEFMQLPYPGSGTSFEKENNNLVSYIYDFQKGRIMKLNITTSIFTGQLDLLEYDNTLPPHLFEYLRLDPDTYFIKEIASKNTQQLRFIYRNGETHSKPILEKLNGAVIQEGEDFNILSCISGYSNNHKKIVEVPIGLNNINIYSLDGTFAKTICMEDKLSDISSIQETFRWNRKYTFAHLNLFDKFFGVVFINEDEKTYQMNRRKLPKILLFDWNGVPLAEININTHFTSFDIDILNQELYTFDLHTDEFHKYNFKNEITEIQIKLTNLN